jgi:opacity protein-like surface antigen
MTRYLLAFVLLVSCFSFAQERWVASVYFGTAHSGNSDVTLNQPSLGTRLRFSNVAFESQSFTSPLYYGGYLGRFFGAHFGAEVEFTHLKAFAKVAQPVSIAGTLNGVVLNTVAPMNSVVQHFSISHGVNLLTANAVWRQPLLRNSRLNVYGKFGVGTTIPHAESVVQLQSNEHYQVGSPVIQIAAGAETRVWHRVFWMAEYKFTHTAETVGVHSGTTSTTLNTNHIVTGPALHF